MSIETEANLFAINLLVPLDMLEREVEKIRHFDEACDEHIMILAERFQVPVAVIVLQLAELKA